MGAGSWARNRISERAPGGFSHAQVCWVGARRQEGVQVATLVGGEAAFTIRGGPPPASCCLGVDFLERIGDGCFGAGAGGSWGPRWKG